MLRTLAQILVVILLLAIAAVIVILLNLNRLVKAGVEKGGSAVLGVPVSLERASVSLLKQSIDLRGLNIGSPEGFSAPQMFQLSRLHASAELSSLRSKEIVIREVVLEGVEVTLERAKGKTNWGVLQERLKKQPAPEQEKEQKRIRIDRIVFTNGRIKVVGIPLVGKTSIPLPGLEIKDLRSAEGKGAMAQQVLAAVVESLYKAVLSAVENVIPTEQIGKTSQEALSAGQEAVSGAAGAVKDSVKGGLKEGKRVLDSVFGSEKK